ncbi:MAG TPA: hypothetical protein VL484_06495 [Vicinamibacterales bacterium]|jgi:hypothetical protein|nr:hypothetical protein [Vicinamibacterales bacterium]
MKPIRTIAFAAVLAFAAGLAGAAAQTESKSKITVKDGKDVKVTGCVVAAGEKDAGYHLTNVADKKGTLPDYVLLGKDDDDFAKEVGHRVEIEGLAADRGGKVEVETKSKTEVEHGKDRESHTKSTIKGDMPGLTLLSVKSMRTIAAVCP